MEEKEADRSLTYRIRTSDLSGDPLLERRRMNFGVGEVKIVHPNKKEVESWLIKDVLNKQVGLFEGQKIRYPPLVVDNEETFWIMMGDLESVNELAVTLECCDKASYLGSMVWLKLGTFIGDYLIDFHSLNDWRKLALRAYLGDASRIVVMFGCRNDVIFLRRFCGIFLTGVFDVQTFWVELNDLRQTPCYRNVMEDILRKRIEWSSDTNMKWRSDYLTRLQTPELVMYMQEDVHYLYQAWLIIKAACWGVPGPHLQRLGVDPVKVRVSADDFIEDRDINFEEDLREFYEWSDYVQVGGDDVDLAKLLWEHRKQQAMIYDRRPEDVCCMQTLLWMAVEKPTTESAFLEGVANEGKDSPLFKRSRIWTALINEGIKKWEKMTSIECFTCGNFGHLYTQCYRKHCSHDYRRYLQRHPETAKVVLKTKWKKWYSYLEKNDLPPWLKPKPRRCANSYQWE